MASIVAIVIIGYSIESPKNTIVNNGSQLLLFPPMAPSVPLSQSAPLAIMVPIATMVQITNGSPLSPLVYLRKFDRKWTVNVTNPSKLLPLVVIATISFY
jgi:hypothetical protein